MIHFIGTADPFPPISSALREPAGLLAVGADLSPDRLVDAYRRGIFPWFSDGDPILWWSLDPRMVLFADEFHVSRSLRKHMRKLSDAGRLEVRCDTALEAVMRECAAPRDADGGSWIVAPMIAAYVRLHRQGIAHSIETWIDERLVGGMYGISLGRMFYGESMFSRETDASKMALAHLMAFAQDVGIPLIDCQQQTAHLASMGARPIPRADFGVRIAQLVDEPTVAWPSRFALPTGEPHRTHATGEPA